jgi:hypothetical protein
VFAVPNASTFSNILLSPYYFLQLFSTAKSFRDNPIIGSKLLNRLGLHVWRIKLSDWAIACRRWQLSGRVAAADRERFLADGFLVKEDFLPPELFEQLRQEVARYDVEGWACYQGDTITHRILLDEKTLRDLPACRALLKNRSYRNLLAWTAGIAAAPVFYIQRIFNGAVAGMPADPQKNLHSDTFHSTVKAWLFLDDVPKGRGPFTYVPGSHRMTPARLQAEYERSLVESGNTDHYTAKGSLRWDRDRLAAMGLPPPKEITARANTLVIADTRGIHCRGSVEEACMRCEIWVYSRPNPFWPFAGFEIPGRQQLRDALIRWWLEYQARKAARRNRKPSWRPERHSALPR